MLDRKMLLWFFVASLWVSSYYTLGVIPLCKVYWSDESNKQKMKRSTKELHLVKLGIQLQIWKEKQEIARTFEGKQQVLATVAYVEPLKASLN